MHQLNQALRYPWIALVACAPCAQFRMRYLGCRVMFNIFYPVSFVFLWTHFVPVALQTQQSLPGTH